MTWFRVGFWYGPCYLGSITLQSFTPETAKQDALAWAPRFGGLFGPLPGSFKWCDRHQPNLVQVELELERITVPPTGGYHE